MLTSKEQFLIALDSSNGKSIVDYNATERNFGLTISSFLFVISVYPLLNGNSFKVWALIFSLIFFVFSLVAPRHLAPLNFLWGKFSLMISKVMTPVTFGVIYVFAIVPIAFLMRIFRKDPLNLKFQPKMKSYWCNRDDNESIIENLRNQF